MENDVASQAVAPRKALSSFFLGIHDFWRSTDDDNNRKQTFLRGSLKKPLFVTTEMNALKSSPVKCAGPVNSTPLSPGSELASYFMIRPVFCLYSYLNLTVPGSEVAFPCPKLFFPDSNWCRNTCSRPKALFNSEQANSSGQKDLLPSPQL